MSEEDLEIGNLDGVGDVTKDKLNSIGIYTILDLVVRSPLDIADMTGIDRDKCRTFCDNARQKMIDLGMLQQSFVPAKEIDKQRQNIERISTSVKSLDDLFNGGIETQAVTELYGEFGSGKTQICHTLCVMVQKDKNDGGLDGAALYIDTEGTFRPERIKEIGMAKGVTDPLNRVTLAKAFSSSHQELLLQDAGKLITEKGIRLIIVDSAVAHYRAEYLGRGTLSERQQRLNRFMHMLLRIAETYNIAAVITNQVQASPDTFWGDPIKATGGNVLAHTSTYRVYLKKAGKNRVARMVDSPNHAEREVLYKLGEAGVEDSEEKKKKEKSD